MRTALFQSHGSRQVLDKEEGGRFQKLVSNRHDTKPLGAFAKGPEGFVDPALRGVNRLVQNS